MPTERVILKAQAGAQDLLLGAGSVVQVRCDQEYTIFKINAGNLPYSGDINTGNFLSIESKVGAVEAIATAVRDDLSSFQTLSPLAPRWLDPKQIQNTHVPPYRFGVQVTDDNGILYESLIASNRRELTDSQAWKKLQILTDSSIIRSVLTGTNSEADGVYLKITHDVVFPSAISVAGTTPVVDPNKEKFQKDDWYIWYEQANGWVISKAATSPDATLRWYRTSQHNDDYTKATGTWTYHTGTRSGGNAISNINILGRTSLVAVTTADFVRFAKVNGTITQKFYLADTFRTNTRLLADKTYAGSALSIAQLAGGVNVKTLIEYVNHAAKTIAIKESTTVVEDRVEDLTFKGYNWQDRSSTYATGSVVLVTGVARQLIINMPAGLTIPDPDSHAIQPPQIPLLVIVNGLNIGGISYDVDRKPITITVVDGVSYTLDSRCTVLEFNK